MPRRVQDIILHDKKRSNTVTPVKLAQKSTPKIEVKESVPTRIDNDIVKESPFVGSDSNSGEILIKKMPIAPPMKPFPPKKRSSAKGLLVSIGSIVVVGVLVYVASIFFSRATFVIVPKSLDVDVDGVYIAHAMSTSTANDNLRYEVMEFSFATSSMIRASDGPLTETKAKGKINVYNNYSTSAQKLIAGTKFSDPSGKIYKLAESITVPGKKTAANGQVTMGKTTANVIAEKAGAEYNLIVSNIPSSDWAMKIVAYKGLPKYDGFYAKPITDMSGGFAGYKKIVNQQLLASATSDAKSFLNEKIQKALEISIPATKIFYTNAIVNNFSSTTIGGGPSGYAEVGMTVKSYAIVFDKRNLTTALAGVKAIEKFGKYDFYTDDVKSLAFAIVNPKNLVPNSKADLSIRFKGKMKLIGDVPVPALKQKLAGLSLSETKKVILDYKEVIDMSSSGQIVPPWSKVPTDISRISITINKP